MHSIVFIFKRHAELTLEEFYHHYEHVHGPIARQLPGLVEYRQHPVREAGSGDGDYADKLQGYDAISTYTFESAEAAAVAWTSETGKILDDDTLRMLDVSTMITMPVTIRTVFTQS
ncbi:EthD domain-containing protein [Paenibacillus sp. SZ31]|uniref:EthD domain-containing protein n=1 Tax=unclassified Paenibacillus TaxID=185978 RepID=UPI00146F81A8|nr:EthD domain-containing protein [Paenibacillus sp. SZ31]NMI03397.1 EthD domain-containing protein [Paenibacillus sp. SZ31]